MDKPKCIGLDTFSAATTSVRILVLYVKGSNK